MANVHVDKTRGKKCLILLKLCGRHKWMSPCQSSAATELWLWFNYHHYYHHRYHHHHHHHHHHIYLQWFTVVTVMVVLRTVSLRL